jgi:predicted phosphodiesterase
MRIYALSDIHVDYEANAKWVANVSRTEYKDDVLILAGDVSDSLRLLGWCIETLANRFRKVLFVPGNHDLWVIRDDREKHSLQKFQEVMTTAESSGAFLQPFVEHGVAIVPLLGWYDYSFGEPDDELKSTWMDYRTCRWPVGYREREIAAHFDSLNEAKTTASPGAVITFSHFLPRIDLMPSSIPMRHRFLYPVLGSALLERRVRSLQSSIHVYGHSHVKRRISINGVTYINNAFGYPQETWLSSKSFLCIHEA